MATRATTCSSYWPAGGEGLGGRGKQLSAALRRFEPFGRDLAAINGLLAKRRQNISRSITSFRQLSDVLARTDVRLAEWVTAQKDALAGFANENDALRESLRELPPTLAATREGLESADRFSTVLGPAATSLIPTARSFAPAQESLQRFLTATVGPIRDQIRPFTRQVEQPVRHLKQASGPLAETANSSASAVGDLNRLFNAWAYNPPGGAEEGYLFWTGWLNHNVNSAAQLQDANGPLARGIVMQSCATARQAETLAIARPFIWTLQRYANAPEERGHLPARPERPADDRDRHLRPARAPRGDRWRLGTERHSDPGRGRFRDLVLRPRPVPVARLRRTDPAEARGLPGHNPGPGGDPARAGVGRADLRGFGRHGEEHRARR